MNQLTRNIPSTEVAEMVGRDHNEVLKDIRRIMNQLGEGNLPQSYFIESTYTNTQNKELPCFLLTKKGCELYGTRMTGEKGTQFAVKYIERFNEMEYQQVQNVVPLSKDQALVTVLRTTADLVEDTQAIRNEQHEMRKELSLINEKVEEQITLTSGEQRTVQKEVAIKVYEIEDDTTIRPKLFRELHREIKDRFAVASYKDVRRQDLQMVLNYIRSWVPRKVS
ncbi:Rha family transcriptional regulator [Lysinibacillus fusiformis]|uniref:Rha family transcriptional regulator n=1 Tax=Lysinibacillus fusiformis TaxID=28031 RepID=UPI00088E2DF6|nr:Rha family transcriptional regulator [Lysinibacillus fusiformis]SCX52249.1 phage regulatory protein, rha family [Lysinibacillus fusiformis]SDB27547.1 phage regulatory protein, rha family [Lysinibacillus fusiformis]SFI21369.1 phage regulatory protein, rha family [Lysinibacillus fusiformis]SFS81630.1 phage regulatory protein, rha family [Lysinibacillus fusiformis]